PQKNRNRKAGKGKPSAVVDAMSTEEMSKDQLEEHIVRLREELDREREERSYFQLERDKIHACWEICKRKLEEMEADLRNNIQEKDEAEERHRVEITVYKQKLKHVLSEQHNTAFEVRMDAVSSSSLLQNQNMESELRLRREVQDLQADRREKRLQEHKTKIKYYQKIRSLMDTEEKKRKLAITEVEEQMKSRVASLMEEHDRALRKGEEYFSQIQEKQQDELNKLKEEMKKLQKEEVQRNKDFSAAQQENHRLKETLQEVQQKLPELHGQVEEHKHSKESTEKYRAQQKVVEKELRDLTVEHELLLQAFQKVQEERDELLKRQTESILDIQQRSGLKKILLQKKLAAVTETLEKKEAQLSTALSVCSIEPTARSNAVSKLE
ncbi:hypothetical protein GOODEAATRI_032222, partial [Goodea atripinnis]